MASHENKFMDQQFIGQQFIYKDESNVDDNVDDKKCNKEISEIILLVFGYIHNMEKELNLFNIIIPIDVFKLIKYFYGKKYYINGPGPNNDEFDYAVEILTPINMLGITHNHNRICSCNSKFAKKNIIVGSQIIQMNDKYISENVHKNDWRIMSQIFKEIKQKTPSCIVFRHKKNSIDKGLHFQINVSFDNISKNNNKRFPYHKFTKKLTESILNKAFGNNDLIEVYQIYGYKIVGGVCILCFYHNEEIKNNGFNKNEWIEKKEKEILEYFHKDIDKNCVIKIEQELFERRGNRLNCGFLNICTEEEFMRDKQTLMSLVYTVKGIDDGRSAWYLVLCDPDKIDIFLKELNAPIIHLEDHGHIINSSYGDDMPKIIEQNAFKMYDF